MLAIRMQRTGRKGHAMFRVIVQDSRRTPTSGKVVANLGSYDPHAKAVVLDKDKTSFYLEHGAQPSDRAARLLSSEGIKLPGWVKVDSEQKRAVRNPDKRRSTRPAEPAAETPTEEVAEVTDTTAEETPTETANAEPAAETQAAEAEAAEKTDSEEPAA